MMPSIAWMAHKLVRRLDMNSFAVAQIIYDYWTTASDPGIPFLQKPAFPTFVAHGQCGNQEGEYSLAWPPARGDGKKAAGAAQWHADRRERILTNTGINVETAGVRDQQRAIWWEINHPALFPQCLKMIQAAKNEQDVVDALVDKFEYSGDRVRDKARRGADALKWKTYFEGRIKNVGTPVS